MTLDTRVYVLDEADALEVFEAAQRILTRYDPLRREPGQQRSRNRPDSTWRKGEETVAPDSPWTISNEPGQDLPAWLMLHYRPGAALRTAEFAAMHDEYCNVPGNSFYDEKQPDRDGSGHARACWLELSVDTAYGYHDSQGRGCGDLHALMVAELGAWLDERSLSWSWMNEFTGEVHGGPDRYRRLTDLVTGGFEAQAWYKGSVLPAILASAFDVRQPGQA